MSYQCWTYVHLQAVVCVVATVVQGANSREFFLEVRPAVYV
jgi:hypothetical protein